MQTAAELTPARRQQLLDGLCGGQLPDEGGYFGPFGGCFAPEILVPALARLATRVHEELGSSDFRDAFAAELGEWAGRPTPLTRAAGLSERWGADIWLKREDQARTGGHAINNALGQALLAKGFGVRQVIAATGSGQHGVAAAAASRHVGLRCTIYMGSADSGRWPSAVHRMRDLGAEIVEVDGGDRTLCAALEEAFRGWVRDPEGNHFLPGSAIGPHPYPYLVRELQTVIGREARSQVVEASGALPDAVFAAIGEGGGAAGLFHPFLADAGTQLIGVEAGGRGRQPGAHAASLCLGAPGIVHGCVSLWLQDSDGQLLHTHSAAAGMNYPGAEPEHALLQAICRAQYVMAKDEEALSAGEECARVEGIRCDVESAHALAAARRWACTHRDRRVLICVSGAYGGGAPATASAHERSVPASVPV